MFDKTLRGRMFTHCCTALMNVAYFPLQTVAVVTLLRQCKLADGRRGGQVAATAVGTLGLVPGCSISISTTEISTMRTLSGSSSIRNQFFRLWCLILLVTSSVVPPSLAQRVGGDSPNNPSRPPNQDRSKGRLDLSKLDLSFRTISGFGNNLENPDWGAANIELLRKAVAQYGDGSSLPGGSARAGARQISNLCMAQPESIENRGMPPASCGNGASSSTMTSV